MEAKVCQKTLKIQLLLWEVSNVIKTKFGELKIEFHLKYTSHGKKIVLVIQINWLAPRARPHQQELSVCGWGSVV